MQAQIDKMIRDTTKTKHKSLNNNPPRKEAQYASKPLNKKDMYGAILLEDSN
jgi:hypothetical protein